MQMFVSIFHGASLGSEENFLIKTFFNVDVTFRLRAVYRPIGTRQTLGASTFSATDAGLV